MQEDAPPIGLLSVTGSGTHVELISDGSQHHMHLVKYHPRRQWGKARSSHLHPVSCNLCEVTELGEMVTLPGLSFSSSGNQNDLPHFHLPHSHKCQHPQAGSGPRRPPPTPGRGREAMRSASCPDLPGCRCLPPHPASEPRGPASTAAGDVGGLAPLPTSLLSRTGPRGPGTDSSVPLS